MKSLKMMTLSVLVVSALLTGCEKPASTPRAESKSKEHDDHDHGLGPNGGMILDLGKYHAELVLNREAQQATLYFLDGYTDEAELLAVAAKEFSLVIPAKSSTDGQAGQSITVTLKAKNVIDGKATTFTGSNPSFANPGPLEATILGEIDGKPSQGVAKIPAKADTAGK